MKINYNWRLKSDLQRSSSQIATDKNYPTTLLIRTVIRSGTSLYAADINHMIMNASIAIFFSQYQS